MAYSGSDRTELRREVARYEELLQKAEAIDSPLIEQRAVVMLNLAENLLQLGEYDQAASRFAEAVAILWRFERQHVWAANGAGRQAVALMMLGRDSEAVDVLNDLVARVGVGWVAPDAEDEDAEDVIADMVPIALAPWLLLLERLGRTEEMLSAADALIDAYDPASSWRRLLVVVGAFEKKGGVAASRGDDAAALGSFGSAIERCRDQIGEELEARDGFLAVLARALAGRAAVFERAGRTAEALADYDTLTQCCAASPDPATAAIVAAAREGSSRLRPGPRRLRRV